MISLTVFELLLIKVSVSRVHARHFFHKPHPACPLLKTNELSQWLNGLALPPGTDRSWRNSDLESDKEILLKFNSLELDSLRRALDLISDAYLPQRPEMLQSHTEVEPGQLRAIRAAFAGADATEPFTFSFNSLRLLMNVSERNDLMGEFFHKFDVFWPRLQMHWWDEIRSSVNDEHLRTTVTQLQIPPRHAIGSLGAINLAIHEYCEGEPRLQEELARFDAIRATGTDFVDVAEKLLGIS